MTDTHDETEVDEGENVWVGERGQKLGFLGKLVPLFAGTQVGVQELDDNDTPLEMHALCLVDTAVGTTVDFGENTIIANLFADDIH